MLPIYMFTRRTNNSCPRGFAVRQTTLLGYSTISVACLCLAGGFYLLLAGEATLSLTVLDLESGLPISNATVTAGWEMPNPDGDWGSGPVRNSQKKTDESGFCRVSLGSAKGYVQAEHSAFYSSGLYNKADLGLGHSILALNKPSLTIKLLKKINPVDMYVRKVSADRGGKIPALDTPCGFDLKRCAWVKPYGDGETADFVVTAKLAYRGDRDYDYVCTLSYPGHLNGIQVMQKPPEGQNSSMKFPRSAPLNGYLNSWSAQGALGQGPLIHATPDAVEKTEGAVGEDGGFVFRVRGKATEDEKSASSCLYGKIHGPISIKVLPWYPKPEQQMFLGLEFRYYLNPNEDNTSLESMAFT